MSTKKTPTAAAAPSAYDEALASFHAAEQHLAGLRQRRAEAERTAADLKAKADAASAARRQAVVDADMKSAGLHGEAATTATAAAVDAAEIAEAMVAGIEQAERALVEAETALDDERRRVLDGFADSEMPRLLDAIRKLALPIYRARAGAGDRLSYRQFLEKLAVEADEFAFGDVADAKLNLPVPSFMQKSTLLSYSRRNQLGLPIVAA